MTETPISQKEDLIKATEISDSALEKLEIYHDLLVKWQKAVNLVSPKTLPQVWHRHFLDSAQISKLIPPDTKTYADLGCGAGFPGLVLAIMHPEIDVHLVESDEKKCQFMRTVIRETKTQNTTIHTTRIESVYDDITPDFITARALSSLENLLEYCLPWARQNKNLRLCFMKGEQANEEIVQAQKRFTFEYTAHPSITDSAAKLLLIQKLACV